MLRRSAIDRSFDGNKQLFGRSTQPDTHPRRYISAQQGWKWTHDVEKRTNIEEILAGAAQFHGYKDRLKSQALRLVEKVPSLDNPPFEFQDDTDPMGFALDELISYVADTLQDRFPVKLEPPTGRPPINVAIAQDFLEALDRLVELYDIPSHANSTLQR